MEKEKKEKQLFIKPFKNYIYEIDAKIKTIEKTIWAYRSIDEYKKNKMPRCIAIVFCQKKSLFSKTNIVYKEIDIKKQKEIVKLVKETEQELKEKIKEIKWN